MVGDGYSWLWNGLTNISLAPLSRAAATPLCSRCSRIQQMQLLPLLYKLVVCWLTLGAAKRKLNRRFCCSRLRPAAAKRKLIWRFWCYHWSSGAAKSSWMRFCICWRILCWSSEMLPDPIREENGKIRSILIKDLKEKIEGLKNWFFEGFAKRIKINEIVAVL